MPPSKGPAGGSARGGLVTVRSIAQAAGVSIGAVSSVLNNRQVERRISPETVQKVRSAIAKLGYLPNLNARRLRSGATAKNNLVLALVSSFEAPISLLNHFVIALRQVATSPAGEAGHRSFSLMIEMYAAGRLCDLPGLLAGDHFNAAIIMNTTPEDDQYLARSHLPYPVVLVNRIVPGYASVVEDDSAGSRSADILFRGKRRHLAVLRGSPLTQTTQVRADRFMRRAAELAGRSPAEIVAEGLSEAGGYGAMREFLRRKAPVDGVYAVSDALALGAYRAIKEQGASIPRDVAVIGTGDYEIAPFFDPPLSSVGVLHEEFARHAAALLLRQLGRGARPGETEVVPVRQCLRTSSGHGPA